MTDFSAAVWDFNCHAATVTSEPTVDYVKMSDILVFKENDELVEVEVNGEMVNPSAEWITVGKLQSQRKGHAVSIIRRSEMASVCVRWNQGIINSPNYPNSYPNNVYQVTQFTSTHFSFLYALFPRNGHLRLLEGMGVRFN